MTGFQAPNYTQVPNDYFDLVMEMTEAEIKILTVLIRSTFGYHRDEIQVSVRELANATKMSTSSVWVGAEKLEERGLIERSVSKNNTVTNWRVVISDTKLYRQIVKTVSNDSEVNSPLPLKKEKKKESKDIDFKNLSIIEAKQLPTIKMYTDATDFFPGSVIWEHVHNFILANNLTYEKIHAAAVAWGLEGYKKENVRGLLEWARDGVPVLNKPKVKVQSIGQSKQEQNLANIQSWLTKKQESQNGNTA